MSFIDIYTDGSCSGNPGPGGWAFVIVNKHNRMIGSKEGSSLGTLTTNNRQELFAAIEAIRYCSVDDIHIHTDSRYVLDGATKWMANWKKKGWKGVKNKDLWLLLAYYIKKHTKKIQWSWIKAHNGNKWNELVDEMAKRGSIC